MSSPESSSSEDSELNFRNAFTGLSQNAVAPINSTDQGVAVLQQPWNAPDHEPQSVSQNGSLSATTSIASGSTLDQAPSAIDEMRRFVESGNIHSSYSGTANIDSAEAEIHRHVPIFTSKVSTFLEAERVRRESQASSFPQFGLIGVKQPMPKDSDMVASSQPIPRQDNDLIIANMDTPWAAFICGSQGAGKSHTLSCLLENALVKNSSLGSLPNPLAAMVFHYDNYTSSSCSQVCEAAYLCSSGVPVTVLVSPSNIWAMTKLYHDLPGLPADAPRPRVQPLYLSENALDITTMLKLMAIDPTSDSVPLYVEIVMSILREMAMEGRGVGAFSYADFRARLADTSWVKGQQGPLNMRLQLLDSFLEPSPWTKTTRPAPAVGDIWTFEPGTMTIVDLSDPFIDGNDACMLFSICLSVFLEDRARCGRIVALDEAHKFLTQSGAARALTRELTTVIRQQRHTGTRVIIATQEPTLAPEIIDLANATFVHRFLSPAWYNVLSKHLAGAQKNDSDKGQGSLFEEIIGLGTGEALLFCPTALVTVDTSFDCGARLEKLGSGYLKVKIRHRLTANGGKSILASETTATAPNIPSVQDIPMHIVDKRPITRAVSKGTGRDFQSAITASTIHQPATSTTTVPTSVATWTGGAASVTNRVTPTFGTVSTLAPPAFTFGSTSLSGKVPTTPPVLDTTSAAQKSSDVQSQQQERKPANGHIPSTSLSNTTSSSIQRVQATVRPLSKQASKQRIERSTQEARTQLRANLTRFAWKTKREIDEPRLLRDVEAVMGLSNDTISSNVIWKQQVLDAARHEFKLCSKK